MNIRYDLSPLEVLQFPLLSPYGLRHIKEGGFFHTSIGVIELFPGLGPVVSLIEGIVSNIIIGIQENARLKKSGLANKLIGAIEIIPVIGTIVYRIDDMIRRKKILHKDLAVKDPEKWIADFKKNIQEKKAANPKDLSLTPEQTQNLSEVISFLKKNRWNYMSCLPKAKLLAANLDWIFTMDEIPGIVFKVPMHLRSNEKSSVEKRYETTSLAKEVIEKEGFDRLHVPEQKLIYLNVGSEKIPVLVEQCFDIVHGTYEQESLFQRCYKDPELKPYIRECSRQLILFIIKTGFSDVRYDNNPLLSDGRGFALIDLDRSSNPTVGLMQGCSNGADGILQYLPVEEIEFFEPILKKELSEKTFNALNLEALKERLRKQENEEPDFLRYLARKKVASAREPVDLTGYNPFADRMLVDLEEKINDIASYRLGFNLSSDRRFYVKNYFRPGVLDGYKKRGLIFNWQNFKEINPNSAGYYIWA